MTRPRALPLSALILITLLVQLGTPGIAWADGEAPPTEAEPAAEVWEESVPTVAEILEAAPPETELVVVDASGTPEPLASQEAAQAILESDPEWCPDGYTPGDPECTGSFLTVDALLDEIGSGSYSGNGTIYFDTDYTTHDAFIRGSDPRLVNLRNLGIDGQGYTLSVPLEVTGWLYDVSITNLDMAGATSALRVETTGAIAVTDINISGSGGDGAYLDNTSGTASITVTDSTFNANTWTGLDARSHGDITLTDVVATGQEDGAYLDASGGLGAVTVGGTVFGDSDFSGNTLAGLTAKTASGKITINNVIADNNTLAPAAPTALAAPATLDVGSSEAYGLGLTASAGGAIDVIDSGASHNDGRGLWIEGTGPILLNNVIADANGADGAYLHNLGTCSASPISVSVDGGTFTNNGGYGLHAVLGPAGALTFINPATFAGNALGDYAVNLDPCPECDKEGGEGKPYNTINVPEIGIPPVPLDCELFAGTIFILPSGDRAMLVCPVQGEATASPVPANGLPGPLPAGRTHVSGIAVGMTKSGQPVLTITEGGYLKIAFPIPEDLRGKSLAILYWDPIANGGVGGWVELPPYAARPDGSPLVHRLHPSASPDDGMYILGGVRVFGDSATVEVNFAGTFVLVAR